MRNSFEAEQKALKRQHVRQQSTWVSREHSTWVSGWTLGDDGRTWFLQARGITFGTRGNVTNRGGNRTARSAATAESSLSSTCGAWTRP